MRNKKIKSLFAILISSFMFLFVAVPVMAQGEQAGPESVDDLIELIEQIAVWFQAIVLAIAVIMIIWAGLLWMTAGGDEEKLGKARRTLIYGLIGIAIVLFAYAAVAFITSLLS